MDLIIISGAPGRARARPCTSWRTRATLPSTTSRRPCCPHWSRETGTGLPENCRGIAVCIDARNAWRDLQRSRDTRGAAGHGAARVLYLDADEETLIKRFSETRRRHPLSSESLPLAEALRRERELLEPLAASCLVDPRHPGHDHLRAARRDPPAPGRPETPRP
jgi:UPF0042 nucleotide-binding protein